MHDPSPDFLADTLARGDDRLCRFLGFIDAFYRLLAHPDNPAKHRLVFVVDVPERVFRHTEASI